jgi:hypothetical protein
MGLVGVIVAALLIVTLISYAGGASRGNSLRRGMIRLGDVTLHTYDEVVSVLGRPNALSSIGNGVELAQWMSGGYHVAMSFGPDGKCLGIDSEVSV